MLEFIVSVLLAIAGWTPSEPIRVDIHYASGIVMIYQVEVEEGQVAQFDMLTKVIRIGATNFEVGNGDTVCLPLAFVPQQMHRIATPDGDPYNGRGCFVVTSDAVSPQ